MAGFRKKTISRRTVDGLEVEKDTVFWDRELVGFGVRVYPSGRKVYIAQARAKGKAAQRVPQAMSDAPSGSSYSPTLRSSAS